MRHTDRFRSTGLSAWSLVAVIGALLSVTACDRAKTSSEAEEEAEASGSTSDREAAGRPQAPEAVRPQPGPVPETWVSDRVTDARTRLQESEPGRRVWDAIEAHGGLATWLQKGTIAFDFDYAPVDAPERRMYTRSQVDLWESKARQKELGEDADATLGFDGTRSWITPGPEAFPSPARFWATTPYYFVGLPFVLGDPGVKFETLPDAPYEGVDHHMVKITYEAGTGDSPDDYYVLYLHPETKRLSAIRYIVAYPGFFPEGGHTPEKLMRYLDYEEVDGLLLPHRFETYTWDAEAGTRTEKVTDVTVANYALGETLPADVFSAPDGAYVSTELEGRAR